MRGVIVEIDKITDELKERVWHLQLEQRQYDYYVGYFAAMDVAKKLIREAVKKAVEDDNGDFVT